MTIDLPNVRVQLPVRQPLTLTDARGTRLRAVAGTTWITIDHDPRDVVLEPGDEFIVESSARVPVMAMGRAAVTIDLCARRHARQHDRGTVPSSRLALRPHGGAVRAPTAAA